MGINSGELLFLGILVLLFLFSDTFIMLGAILGVYMAKQFIFNEVELMGWQIFWDSLIHGHINLNDMKEIVTHSTTFYKSLAGALLGGLIGSIIKNFIYCSNHASKNYAL